MSVQRQLREDWDNREYEQIIADNVKNIANFLSSFGWFQPRLFVLAMSRRFLKRW
ncbi:unnamed protein product [Nippostrongylus brasiliensis]|uniref:Uncharacterized protein n=1 Tax=Nippostrongylus brasiliensis TaxID=27835 RepID=A0A0N4XV12_NIPBR|nr:unnamed protein product [Nippostrongylus brasiliensis]